MPGFTSSTTAMTICKVNATVNLTLDALRTHAFTLDVDADGGRLGRYRWAIRWIRTALLWPPWMAGIPALPFDWICARNLGPLSGSGCRSHTRGTEDGKKVGSKRKNKQRGSHHRQASRQSEICTVHHTLPPIRTPLRKVNCVWPEIAQSRKVAGEDGRFFIEGGLSGIITHEWALLLSHERGIRRMLSIRSCQLTYSFHIQKIFFWAIKCHYLFLGSYIQNFIHSMNHIITMCNNDDSLILKPRVYD